MIIYIFLVNLSLILCFLLYRTFFRRLTFFQWNRFYLLGAVLFSMLIPIGLFIDLSSFWEEHIPTVDLYQVFYTEIIIVQTAQTPLYLMDVLVPVYWTGVTLMMIWTLFRLYKLWKAMQSVDDYRSFSFFSKVILGRKLADNNTIQDHERIHVEQGHSYDLVLMELICAFNWFNPVLYLYRKELKFQHECIADELCAEDRAAYAELLVAHALRTDMPLMHEFSNHSFLKKRIMMLFKNKSNTKHKYLYLTVIPAVLIVTLSTLVFNTSKAKNIVQSIEHHIYDVQVPLKKQSQEEQVENIVSDNPSQTEKNTTVPPQFNSFDTIIRGDDGTTLRHIDTPEDVKRFLAENPEGTRVWTLRDTSKETRTLFLQGTNSRNTDIDSADFNKLFLTVQNPPEFPGGMGEFRRWLGNTIDLPQAAIDAGVKGTIEATFVVERDGSLSDIKILRDLGYRTGEAMVDLLKQSPKWKPGIQNTRTVRVQYKLPVNLNFSQPKNMVEDIDPRIFQEVQIQPEFPGGMDEFRKWIGKNMQYPQAAIDAGVKGIIELTFVVEKDGSLSDIKPLSDLGHGTGVAAVEVLKQSPKWRPGLQNSRPVRVQYKLPITLNIQ